MTPARRRLTPKLAAAGVALIGALLVLAGGLRATTLAPALATSDALTAPRQPIVSTAIGLLGWQGPRLEVDATGAAGRPVFVGIGRARDVDAYLAQVSRLEVDGANQHDGTLLTKRLGSQPTVPDPADADVWVTSSRSAGAASLVWTNQPGQWRMVIASDGTGPAAGKITMTWSGRIQHSPAPALISLGLVFLVLGLIIVVLLRSRARLDADQ